MIISVRDYRSEVQRVEEDRFCKYSRENPKSRVFAISLGYFCRKVSADALSRDTFISLTQNLFS